MNNYNGHTPIPNNIPQGIASRIIPGTPYGNQGFQENGEPTLPPGGKAPRNTATQTEKDFQDTFVDAAIAAGWTKRFHVVDYGPNANTHRMIEALSQKGMNEAAILVQRIGRRRVTDKGFPDWCLSHPQHGVIIAELKSDRNGSKPTPEQWEWLTALAGSMQPPANDYAASRVHLWRPSDWKAITTQLGCADVPAVCLCPVCLEVTKKAATEAPATENNAT